MISESLCQSRTWTSTVQVANRTLIPTSLTRFWLSWRTICGSSVATLASLTSYAAHTKETLTVDLKSLYNNFRVLFAYFLRVNSCTSKLIVAPAGTYLVTQNPLTVANSVNYNFKGVFARLSHCERTSEESGTIGGRKEKEFADDDLTTGKHPTI